MKVRLGTKVGFIPKKCFETRAEGSYVAMISTMFMLLVIPSQFILIMRLMTIPVCL